MINPNVLEYGILALALVAATILMAVGKIQPNDGVPIITAVIAYGVGASKGASVVNAVQSATQNK